MNDKPAYTQKFLLGVLCLFFYSSNAYSQTGFYKLSDKWEKENISTEAKQNVLDGGFSQAISSQYLSGVDIPAPPNLHHHLAELAQNGSTFELELRQALYLKTEDDLIKFIATDDGIVTMETADARTLRVVGNGIGSTFVHVWDSQGRHTFEIRVLRPKYASSKLQLERRQAIEKSRPFKIHYSNTRGAFYNAEKPRELARRSMDFTQNISMDGDTPYGGFSVHGQTQKDRAKNIVTDAQMRLDDGKIGQLRNFNLAVGDSQINPNLMAFPSGRIRGADFYQWTEDKKLGWEGFYGREQSSVIGTLTPGLVGKRTRDSFLSGGVLDYALNENAKIHGGYFTAYGQSRPDELNRRGGGLRSETNLGPSVKLDNETSFDNEKYAHKHAVTVHSEKVTIKNEFRDISKKFQSMIGAPSRQGEVGYLMESRFNPSPEINLRGGLDIFRDRQIPNPEDPGRYNIHRELSLNYFPRDTTSLLFNYQDFDDTGRVGPTKQKVFGGQLNQNFDIWDHKATFFLRYQNRGNRVLNNSDTNYIRDQVTLGLYTEIFWGILFSLQKEMGALQEPNIDRFSRPSAMIYTFDYSNRLGVSPFFLDAQLRIRDEEDTESLNSFMSGDDSTELSLGIHYRETDDLELFLTGSLSNHRPESLNSRIPRVEAQFLTGMRYTFDTKYQWSPAASFDGYVYKDLNGDGKKSDDEPGIEGLTIQGNDQKTTVTNKDGYYEFPSIAGKKAILILDSAKIPYGFVPTSSIRQEIEIVQGSKNRVDFGLTPRSEITGIVFNDLNANGRYDVGLESGVKKVKLTLNDGTSARTNISGVYSFSKVLAGDHTASLVLTSLPDGYLPLDLPKKTFTVFEGIRYELNFPLKSVRQVSGRVFADLDLDGELGPKDLPLADVKVLLGKKEAYSDQDGWYLLDDLSPGIYRLVLDEGTLPDDYVAMIEIPEIKITAEPMTLSGINALVIKKNNSTLSRETQADV